VYSYWSSESTGSKDSLIGLSSFWSFPDISFCIFQICCTEWVYIKLCVEVTDNSKLGGRGSSGSNSREVLRVYEVEYDKGFLLNTKIVRSQRRIACDDLCSLMKWKPEQSIIFWIKKEGTKWWISVLLNEYCS
jgi:hypothetical protein